MTLYFFKNAERKSVSRQPQVCERRKAATLPRRFNVSSFPKEATKPSLQRPQTQYNFQRTQSPQDPYEYDLPPHTPEITGLAPVHPPPTLKRNSYSHSHALNQIRHDLNNKLYPPDTKTAAWRSNPGSRTSSRNPSRHGSRSHSQNPSCNPSRAPSLSGFSYLNDIIDDDVEDLTFHEVESHTVTIPERGNKERQRRKGFSIATGPTEEDNHLPSLPSPQHAGLPPRRQRALSDVSDRRNGFLSQAVTFELQTDLDTNAIIAEFLHVAEVLKMRDLISGKSTIMGVLKGVRIQINVQKDQSGVCCTTFQWISGGDLKSYKEVCDNIIERTNL